MSDSECNYEKTIKDFFDVAEELNDGWVIASFTDSFVLDKWINCENRLRTELSNEANKVLEIRVFSSKGESKISRFDIGKPFRARTIFDEGDQKDSRNHFDELQYLDIDEKEEKTVDGEVTATGGGKYKCPLDNVHDAKIRIRYYLGKYDKTGHARVEDWRAVELVEGREDGKE